MKIVITSDAHGNIDALKKIIELHPDCDSYFDAGDSESDEYSLYPFGSIKGNNDYFSNFEERRMFKTPYGNILIQHRPYIPYEIIKKYNVKLFIHGHIHKRVDMFDKNNNLRILSPGAISYSRDGHDGSYMILNVYEDNVEVEFHQL